MRRRARLQAMRAATANFPAWYGWSADTAERALKTLARPRLGQGRQSSTYRTAELDWPGQSQLLPPIPTRPATAAQPAAPTSLLAPAAQPTFAELLRQATPGPWETT